MPKFICMDKIYFGLASNFSGLMQLKRDIYHVTITGVQQTCLL